MEILNSEEKMIRDNIELQEKKERMYHYTSLDTFFNILLGMKGDHFTFYAGSVYTMNDYKEMQIGYNCIKKYLPEIEQKLKIGKEDCFLNLSSVPNENKQIRNNFGRWLINDDISNFVISFSAKPDILPMWITYGDNGKGVCLEFSPYIIKRYYKENMIDDSFQIKKCIYQEKDIKFFLSQQIEKFYNLFLGNVETKRRKEPLLKAKYFATLCAIAGTFIKHYGFEYEKEIRMNLFKHKDEWLFRKNHLNHHIAYIEAPIPADALTAVIVGPAATYNNVKNSILLSLRSKGISVEPKQSKIPYRTY